MLLACSWHASGVLLACFWHFSGMLLACSWPCSWPCFWRAPGMLLACCWRALAIFWHACGLLLACFWQFLACFLRAPGMLLTSCLSLDTPAASCQEVNMYCITRQASMKKGFRLGYVSTLCFGLCFEPMFRTSSGYTLLIFQDPDKKQDPICTHMCVYVCIYKYLTPGICR